jgi:ubiquinone/menaquinone biosynthesis C-methylase UbiE/glycosyltransferase involved in cell wall biosynthesis
MAMIANQDIICLSSQDWNDLWTRKQRFMQRFARQGNRVLYVETQASLASIGVLRADWRRLFRWMAGPRRFEENLCIATFPLVLPCFQMSIGINTLNNVLLLPLLRRWIKRLGFGRPILWTYNPYSESLLGELGEQMAVYECVDELSAAKGLVRSKVVQELERRLLKKVDVVIVTHENLYQSKKHLAREIYLIPNGAEVDHFRKASFPDTPVAQQMKSIPHPIIGFLGSVQYWIDMDLLRFLALARPDWSFALIGPIGRLAQIDKIRHLPNVYLLGRKPYDDLPSYLKGFDVCLNPYILDETAMNCSPLKLYEYLATGKPVVSVDMPEARKFDGLISVGHSYSEILHLLDEAIKSKRTDPGMAASRIDAVKEHSWDHRFAQLERALEQHVERRMSLGDIENIKERVGNFWDDTPCGTRGVVLEPGTRAYFDRIEAERYRLEPFIPAFAEFPRWRGKRVLEVGVGAGTDFLGFVRSGARIVGIDLSRRSLDLVRQRLAVYELEAPLVHTDAERLPFSSDTFDLAYSWGVLHHTPRMADALAEVCRVLKPGAEARIMLYHRYSWVALFVYLRFGLLAGKPFRSLTDVIASHVESVGTKALTRAETRKLFAGFSDVEVETVLTPYDRLEESRFGRFFPRFLVNLLGDRFGWFMMIRARKRMNSK